MDKTLLLEALIRPSRPFTLLAFAAVVVCAALAGIATGRAANTVDKSFPGFVWQEHGDLITVSAMTSSSWAAFGEIRWGALLVSVDGRPPAELPEIIAEAPRGQTLTIEVSGSDRLRRLRIERFSWEKFVESFGIFLAGGLLFGLCGVFLVYLSEDAQLGALGTSPATEGRNDHGHYSPARQLTRYMGASLVMTSVLVLAGIGGSGVAEAPGAVISILADLAWSGGLATAGPLLIILAGAISPGLLPVLQPSRQRFLLLLALLAWPFCFVLLRTTWGLEEARTIFLYLSLFGLVVLFCTGRTLLRPHWLRSPTHSYAFVVSVPLMFTLLVFVALAALPWALGREFVLPSSVMMPVGCLIPVTLVYSSLAGVWLTGLKARGAATRAMLERHKIALGSMRLLLHDHVLADLKSLRGEVTLDRTDLSAIPVRLLEIESQLRSQLLLLDADRTYNIPDAFPSADDILGIVQQMAPGTKVNLQIDASVAAWPPLVRWLFYCHLASLIRNARIHGRAQNIRIELSEQANDAVLTVDDDGLGFARAGNSLPGSLTAIGLRAAERDIEEEGGRLRLARSPIGGARIEERLPLR